MNTMGNDDQAIWALSGLEAEMTGFQPVPGKAQWLDIAQNVFSQQTGRRIENGGCEGALRWLLFEGTEGYNYVNSASSIGYFEVGAQLAYLTGNTTYIDLADDTFELLEVLDFVTVDYAVYDGAHMDSCTDVNKLQLSYTAAMLLEGSAYLYNLTSDDDWKERIDGLLDRILMTFFENGVALETSCEKGNRCNTDMLFYKGIMLRRLASAMEMAPYTAARILPVLKSSAKAAAAHCTGGDNGRMCGFRWTSGHFDGETGAAQQADVLSALLAVIDVHSAGGSGNGSGKGFDMPQGTGARAGMSVSAFVGALLAGGFLLL
ncbi:glycoside hydrolase [Hypoxylon fragiforme]|uniref:glycoside hydrolase n=1 Tax=Hypoxylon fragiforme TaxID=63214 RepID=UPI0020C5DCE3|nr:glycoside hydrolase [Hypoxylon fragiforme]KAI2607031.1 glycoside hydrolase [Hypoxylon fragiforme]